ncbi:MAG: hypothetical protein LBG22_09440 [Treponema sp.]|jgi:hypothetical protein|nr:hypothetical protein [Treponema sp.]
MGGDILDLYSDYLLASTRKVTATGLSELVDKAIRLLPKITTTHDFKNHDMMNI